MRSSIYSIPGIQYTTNNTGGKYKTKLAINVTKPVVRLPPEVKSNASLEYTYMRHTAERDARLAEECTLPKSRPECEVIKNTPMRPPVAWPCSRITPYRLCRRVQDIAPWVPLHRAVSLLNIEY